MEFQNTISLKTLATIGITVDLLEESSQIVKN